MKKYKFGYSQYLSEVTVSGRELEEGMVSNNPLLLSFFEDGNNQHMFEY